MGWKLPRFGGKGEDTLIDSNLLWKIKIDLFKIVGYRYKSTKTPTKFFVTNTNPSTNHSTITRVDYVGLWLRCVAHTQVESGIADGHERSKLFKCIGTFLKFYYTFWKRYVQWETASFNFDLYLIFELETIVVRTEWNHYSEVPARNRAKEFS